VQSVERSLDLLQSASRKARERPDVPNNMDSYGASCSEPRKEGVRNFERRQKSTTIELDRCHARHLVEAERCTTLCIDSSHWLSLKHGPSVISEAAPNAPLFVLGIGNALWY
jgi:hypothetical protein